MTEHTLYQKVIEKYEYELHMVGDDLVPDYGNEAFIGEERRKTIECTCGERFRKDETALRHLEEVE